MFTPKDINSEEHLENGDAAGEWRDNTTSESRYMGFADEVVERLDKDTGEYRMLDVGCSTGAATAPFASYVEEHTGVAVEVHGLDISSEVLEEAVSEGCIDEAIEGRAQDMDDLGVESDCYDIVVSRTSTSRIPAEEQTEALKRMERVIDEDGVAALEIDSFGKERYTGLTYVMTGEELGEVREESDNFSYPMDDELEEYKLASTSEAHGEYEEGPFAPTLRENAERYDNSGSDDDDILIA